MYMQMSSHLLVCVVGYMCVRLCDIFFNEAKSNWN